MIHDALRLLRVYHNRKQKELASDLGISSSFLSELEAGKKVPSLELLESYSKIFDIPMSAILLFSEQRDLQKASKVKSIVTKKVLRLLDWVESTTRPQSQGDD